MKKLFIEYLKSTLVGLLLVMSACSSNEVKTPEPVSPFKSGDIVYFKLDSTKAVITFELGQFDENTFAYRINYKNNEGKIVGKFILSSEIFKK